MKYRIDQNNYHTFSTFEINKLPARSYFIPYPDRAQADAVGPKEKRYSSPKVLCLNGDWDFKFYPKPAGVPAVLDTQNTDFDKIDELIASCSNADFSDASINIILAEEMPAYFLGQKKLDQVIRIAQDRVQKVLDER